MSRILLFATTTSYQVRAFADAAERLGFELAFATDRCHTLDDPWRDEAIPVEFHNERMSLQRVLDAIAGRPVTGVLAVGDRPTILASMVAEALALPCHGAAGARLAASKLRYRQCLSREGLRVPAFHVLRLEQIERCPALPFGFPRVVKPLTLSGSRGVIRANDKKELDAALVRVAQMLSRPELRALRDPSNELVLIEEYIDGAEYAVEGLVNDGRLHVMTIFDKPDALEGPFFEETIYARPTELGPNEQASVEYAVAEAVRALGLRHGPVHAECRLDAHGPVVLEVAARPIGGLCAKVLQCTDSTGHSCQYEEVLLRQAVGEGGCTFDCAPGASAVMMIPIPCSGHLRGVVGTELARAVGGVDDVIITAKLGQQLVPIPEGASYLGFIFARGQTSEDVIAAVRQAHQQLHFEVDREIPLL